MGRTVVLIVIGVAAVIGGLTRLLWDTPDLHLIDARNAAGLASCLGSREVVPANGAAVTVAPLPDVPGFDPSDPPPRKALLFRVTSAVPFEAPDQTARDALQKTPAKLPAGTSLNVAKGTGAGAGTFEFELARDPAEDPARTEAVGGRVEIRGARLQAVLMTTSRLRFAPATDGSYRISFPKEVTVETRKEGDKTLTLLPAGTEGTLRLEGGQPLVPLQGLVVAPWLDGTTPTLTPVRAVGQSGLANLSIEARQPGLQFNASGLTLVACVSNGGNKSKKSADENSSDDVWQPVGVTEVRAAQPGAATVLISMPPGTLPAWGAISTDIKLVVANTATEYRAFGGFRAIARVWAALFALVVTGALFTWASQRRHEHARSVHVDRLVAYGVTEATAKTKADEQLDGTARWFSGLFIGPDNEPSLSLFQIFIWTVITVWGLAYVFLVTGSLLSLTTDMMALLGIAGTGSVLSRWISESGQPPVPAAPTAKAPKFKFWQMLSTKDGTFDLLKLQLFVFTLTIATYVVWRILDSGAFPTLDVNTLLLMGVSQSVYIGGKLAGTTALAQAQTLRLDLDQLALEKSNLEAKKPGLTADEQKRLDALPALISDRQAAYEKVLKDLNLKPA